MAIAHRVTGGAAHGAAAIVVSPGAGRAVNDIDLMFIETENQAALLTTAAGFALVTGTDVGFGTAAAADACRMTVYWRRWNGTDGDPTITDSGDHQLALIISYSGVVTTGNPWDVVGTNQQTVATTAGSATGVTTTLADTDYRIIIASAGSLPDALGLLATEVSGVTNGNLTGLTERADSTSNAGSGGSLFVADGGFSIAGATGATTFTSVTSATKANVNLVG